MIHEEVPAALDGERLDRVGAIVTGASRADAAVLVAAGGAVIDDEVVTSGKVRLREGQRLVVDPTHLPRVLLPEPDPEVPVDVVYADEHVVVVDKRAGVVVHPAAGNPASTLVNGLLARFPELAGVGEAARPGIVHRLDVGTSGLMLVARSQPAYELLVAALAAHEVERTYRTLVWGHPANAVGVIEAPIGRDHRDPLRMAVVADGKPARTRFRVLRTARTPVEVAELRCRLETGRTHQIRVHLSAIGHPVVGDSLYGGSRRGIDTDRPLLHAEALALRHPIDGRVLEFTSPLPADFAAVLERLGDIEQVTGDD